MSNEAPEIRLALFGPSASGKTTFLASYFGNQQRNSFEEAHGYRLEASDVSDGNQLLSRYYRMEKGEFPLGTEQFFEYRFGFKVGGLPEPGLHVVWYDYPGGWWERTPKDDSEKAARRDALSKLLTSHVGILLVDGMKYVAEGLPYVCHLLDQFRNEARRISDEFAASAAPLEAFPRQWIIAISKADLLPADATAESIGRDIVAGAADQLAGVAKAMNSKSFGSQYLLLSSVRGDGGHVVDAHDFIGLQLVAPVALVSVLSELADKAAKGSGFGLLKAILERLSALVDLVDKLDDFLPPKYQVLTQLLKALALKDGIDKGVGYFRCCDARRTCFAGGAARVLQEPVLTQEPSVRIDLDSVLWRTRGREWDYSFVLRPAHPYIETWYDFHADVFAGTTPGTAPSVTGGFLRLGDGDEVPFIATCFQDATLRDAAGRPIAHYLIWFPSTPGRPTEYEVTADWGAQVVRAFGDEWRSAFAGDGTSEDDLLATARSLLKEVALADGEAVRVDLNRDVVEKKKAPSRGAHAQEQSVTPAGRHGSGDAPPPAALLAHSRVDTPSAALQTPEPSTSIIDAILEGEAHAVGLRGALGTARVVGRGIKAKFQGTSDLAERVARSFGGAVDDEFIQARLPGIHRRVAKAVLPSDPRRGFDALVEALLPRVKATEEGTLEKEVAQAIEAAEDDRVVRVLAVRILALRRES